MLQIVNLVRRIVGGVQAAWPRCEIDDLIARHDIFYVSACAQNAVVFTVTMNSAQGASQEVHEGFVIFLMLRRPVYKTLTLRGFAGTAAMRLRRNSGTRLY